jgi:SAM-dependent methyltransferase
MATKNLLSVFSISPALGALIGKLRRGLDALRLHEPDWRRIHAERDAEFDRVHGVDTGGILEPRWFGVSAEQRRSAVCYAGVDPDEFERGFCELPIDHSEFVFVDIGSGKGRALLLASDYPFQRIVGVEFSTKLHRTAEANIDRFRSRPSIECDRFELHCVDARDYELPREPVVLFLYNPFDAAVMKVVAARVLASYKQHPRDIYVLYANPFQACVWEEAGFERVASGDLFVIYRPPAAATPIRSNCN